MKKKFLALMLTIVMCLGAVACGDPSFDDEDATTTTIYMGLYEGGLGLNWAYALAERFTEEFKDYQIPGVEGKTGIKLEIVVDGNISLRDKRQSTQMVMELNGMYDSIQIANSGYALDITDIVTEKVYDGGTKSIADKIRDTARNMYISNVDGVEKCYKLPYCEYIPVFSYDVDCFDRNGSGANGRPLYDDDKEQNFYFANTEDPDYIANEAREFYSEITGQTFYFIRGDEDNDDTNSNHTKSCGGDGIFGTYDDGHPTTLNELVALCEFMVSKDVTPFNLTGKYSNYANFPQSAIMSALLGVDGVKSMYSFDSKYMEDGMMEIVTGFSDEPLWPGANKDIRKPITQKVKIDASCGYYITWLVERYYAEAFMQVAEDNSWFLDTKKTHTQKDAMKDFIYSGWGPQAENQTGILMECTFWYQEATGSGYHETWQQNNAPDGFFTRKLGILGLPRTFNETVKEGEGEPMAGVDANQGSFYFNSNIANSEEKMHALKVFLQWYYSDEELDTFTRTSNLFRQMDYPLSATTMSAMPYYVQQVQTVWRSDYENIGRLVDWDPAVQVSRDNKSIVERSWNNGAFCWNGAQSTWFSAYRDGLMKGAVAAFHSQFQMVDKAGWGSMYKYGSATGDFTYTKPAGF